MMTSGYCFQFLTLYLMAQAISQSVLQGPGIRMKLKPFCYSFDSFVTADLKVNESPVTSQTSDSRLLLSKFAQKENGMLSWLIFSGNIHFVDTFIVILPQSLCRIIGFFTPCVMALVNSSDYCSLPSPLGPNFLSKVETTFPVSREECVTRSSCQLWMKINGWKETITSYHVLVN